MPGISVRKHCFCPGYHDISARIVRENNVGDNGIAVLNQNQYRS